MKFLILSLSFSISIFVNSQNFTKEDFTKIKPLLEKGVKLKYDEHNGIVWIKSKPISIITPSTFEPREIKIHLYFGLTKIGDSIKTLPLRIVNDLNIPDWIFFNEISVLYGTLKEKKEGERIKYSMSINDSRREVLRSAFVSEISDDIINESMRTFFDKMIEDPKPFSIRYSGEKNYIENFYFIGIKKFKPLFSPVLNTYDRMLQTFNRDY